MTCSNVPKGRALREDWRCELCGRGALEHVAGPELVAELAKLRNFRRSSLGRSLEQAGLFPDPGPKAEEPPAHGRRRP